MAHSSPGAFQSRGQKPLDNIEQRVQTFEILSKRQRFARLMRRAAWLAALAALLALGAFLGPRAWRLYQDMRAPAPVAAPDAAELPQPGTAATLVPGHVFRDCDFCPEVVVVSGGRFVMGSPANEAGRRADEAPQHEVSIAPFAIGKHEVTFAQWDACLGGGGCNGFSPADNGWGRGARPVSGVSWQDAQAYLDWLNAQIGGLRYRLASEAEWEYAARAGEARAYAFGPRVTTTQATFGAGRSTLVGAHGANAFGLFDTHGNVGEWVEDCYLRTYERAPLDGAAVQPAACARRVFRGGGYADRASNLRSAARQSAPPHRRSPSVGFRVARTLEN